MFINCVASVLLFTAYFQIASTISCYDCNSVNNSMCLDPTIYDKDTLQKFLRTTNCEQGVFRTQNQGFFCRKIIQTILRKGHDEEVRVTRGCGWVRHHRECYKADNEDHLETVCQCFSDNCNAGTNVKYSLGIIAIGLGAAFLSFLSKYTSIL